MKKINNKIGFCGATSTSVQEQDVCTMPFISIEEMVITLESGDVVPPDEVQSAAALRKFMLELADK